MSEGRGISNDVRQLNFLKKKISAPYQSIEYWLTVPEFVDDMLEKVRNRETIDNRVVYESISAIYKRKELVKWTSEAGSFNYRLANAAVKRLRKVLGIIDDNNLAQYGAADNSAEVSK